MRPDLSLALAVASLLTLSGCSHLGDSLHGRAPQPAVTVSGAEALLQHLKILDQLGSASPADQAEIAEAARLDFVAVPTSGHRLRYALVLATPGHDSYDPVGAYQLLDVLLTAPDDLSEAERAFAAIACRDLNNLIALQTSLAVGEAMNVSTQEQLGAANQLIQNLAAENASLRQALKQATRKLEAITELEKTLATRQALPGSEP